MSNLISLKNITLSFGERKIFDQAEMTINKGDRIGLIGLNGQGKSTLFKIISGEVHPDQSKPEFVYDKTNELFDLFVIPQELDIEKYSDLTIENFFLSFYPELHQAHKKIEAGEADEETINRFEKMGGWEIQNSYVNYLKGFDLLDITRPVTNLSGGERKKMALSAGLSSKAELLLWDEPTNHLDIETIERFEDELLASNKTFMIISHDRYLLNHTTNKILHIERGKITQFSGTYLDYLVYLEEREKELQKNLDKRQNKHRRELAWMRQGIKARGTRSKKRVEAFHNLKDEIQSIKSRSRKVTKLDLSHSGRKSKQLVEISHGSFAYENKLIFENLDLLICKKDKIALIGPNGAGKSTLIKIIAEKISLTSGELKNAQDLKVVVFDQNRESLELEKTPLEIVGEGSDFITLGDGRKKHINSYLEQFLFTSDQVHRPVATLSGGERNRLQLAMFMKQSADLWVFDEPTNDLDIETIEILERELGAYESAVIIIGHDRAFLDNTCHSTWLVHKNNIEIFEGGYTQVAPYLHAIEMEKSLEGKNKEAKIPQVEKSESKPIKLTYKEKKRLETIEDEILQAEEKLSEVEKELAEFNFDKMDAARQELYQELNLKKEKLSKLVEQIYEDWEKINEKLSP